MRAKRVMIVDALNAYLRAYIVDPSLSTNGQPIGGVKGLFKILQKLVREIKPDEILMVWDGPNGSMKRRQMDKNYKAGRKPLRLNRAYKNLTDEECAQNKMWQQMRAMEYLNQMPIIQTCIPEIEADDVIAYAVQMPYYKGWQKIIVSNDKDFMQLCDDETLLMRPVKNEILNRKRIVEQIGIHPTNMALARAIVGDASDNLPGIKGAGLPTVAKRLNFLSEDKDYTVEDVIEYCENTESKLKLYERIIEDKSLVQHNYNMMQLYAPRMSIQSKEIVRHAIEDFQGGFDNIEIIKMMREDGFGELNWSDLKAGLNHISRVLNQKETS
jgi:DNA polymerase-1